MTKQSDLRLLALSRPGTSALLEHLLQQRSPTRVRDAREHLRLQVRDFGLALRALERHGLAKRLRVGTSVAERRGLNGHLFIEATELAQSLGLPIQPTPAPKPEI